jgi:hypothetical protein
MFNNLSTEWNNNSLIGTNNLHIRRREKEKEKKKVLPPEGRSLKNMLEIDEEESMIYGCEEITKKSVSSGERLP